jgi:PiT family inorganic phosphate transporter
VTLPLAGLVGAITYAIVHFIGGYAGIGTGFAILVVVAAIIYLRSRQAPIDSKNVNAEWEGNLTAGTQEALAKAGGTPEPGETPAVTH